MIFFATLPLTEIPYFGSIRPVPPKNPKVRSRLEGDPFQSSPEEDPEDEATFAVDPLGGITTVVGRETVAADAKGLETRTAVKISRETLFMASI